MDVVRHSVPDNVHQLHVQQTFHVWKTRGCQCSFRLLMMGGMSPEKCWASYKYGIIKCWYIVASCRIFLYELYYEERIHKHQFSVIMTNVYLMKIFYNFFLFAIEECWNHAIFWPITNFLASVLAINVFGCTADTADLLLLKFHGLTKKYMQRFNDRLLNFWYYQCSQVGRYCNENLWKSYDVLLLM